MRQKKKAGREQDAPKRDKPWESLGSAWCTIGKVSALQQKRTAEMMRMQQEAQEKGGRWMEEIPQRWKQPKEEDKTEKKEVRALRCALLNGSAWSTERKYTRSFKGK